MTHKTISIANRKISQKHKPFFVAEMSGNHNQSFERALKILKAAKKSGADAIKLQTYTADTITINHNQNEFVIKDENSLWKNETLYNLYQKAHTPWDWQKRLFDAAKKEDLICFSSPFDKTAVDFLEDLNCPCYKIASFENIDLPLIRYASQTKKPIVISTGMATLQEIEEAVQTVYDTGNQNLILLRCTSSYPALPQDAHLNSIPFLQNQFKCLIGLSDHTMGLGVALASVALGACFIEKHFTLDRNDGGVDSAFSLEPKEFLNLTQNATQAFEALGQVKFGPKNLESKSLQFRRSLYAVKDIKKGEFFTEENIKSIRPSFGLKPKFYDKILGTKATQNISFATPLSFDMIDKNIRTDDNE